MSNIKITNVVVTSSSDSKSDSVEIVPFMDRREALRFARKVAEYRDAESYRKAFNEVFDSASETAGTREILDRYNDISDTSVFVQTGYSTKQEVLTPWHLKPINHSPEATEVSVPFADSMGN